MLQLINVSKSFGKQKILSNLNYTFASRGLIYITGESGSGKTTLFNLVSGFDKEATGKILIDNFDILKLKNSLMSGFHYSICGLIFQDPHFVPYLNIAENFNLVAGENYSRINLFKEYLYKFKVEHAYYRYPYQLSGGELQRVSLARTLAFDYQIILADEPTGSLDAETAELVNLELKNVSNERLVIVVTHNYKHINKTTLNLTLNNGKLLGSKSKKEASKDITLKFKKIDLKLSLKLNVISFKQHPLISLVSVVTFSFIFFIFIAATLVYENLNIYIISQTRNRVDSNYLIIQTIRNNATTDLDKEVLNSLSSQVNIEFDIEPIISSFFYQSLITTDEFNYEVKIVDSIPTVAINSLFKEKFDAQIFNLNGEISVPFVKDKPFFESRSIKMQLEIEKVITESSLYNTPKIYINQEYMVNQFRDVSLPLIGQQLSNSNLNLGDYLINHFKFLNYNSLRVTYPDYDSRNQDYEKLLTMKNVYKFFDVINETHYTIVKANDEMLNKTFKDLISNVYLITQIVLISLVFTLISLLNLVLTYNFRKKQLELALLKTFGASNFETILTLMMAVFTILILSWVIIGFYLLIAYIIIKYKNIPFMFNIYSIFKIFIFSLVIALLSSVDPIIKIRKLNVMKVLKND